MKYGFIGAGNMGGALAQALAKSIPGERIYIADKDKAKASALAQQLGAREADGVTVAAECDCIFLGVKPQVLALALGEIADTLASRENIVLVSMAAGVEISSVREMAGGDYPTIRIMPNTPASIGEGMILYDYTDNVSAQALDAFLSDMSAAGRFDRLPEHLIDAGSAVSGCGPAYVYMMIEALADGGVECGLPRDKAMMYAAQMVSGAAQLVLSSGKHPGELKDAVCSPGGTTIAGVHALEEGAFRSCAINAVTAAYKRTKELGKK
ncbi:MAG: pyrroline-5-carboxylate reductase [Clostridia bacterium]|nr:pyrroline-5-carboxylate reductase [Clostridia bacterium]